MRAKAVWAEGIAAAAASGAVLVKGRIIHGYATSAVEAAATAFTTGIAGVLAVAGIATSRCTAFESGIVDTDAPTTDVSAATMRHSTHSAVLLVTRAVAAVAAEGVAQ